MAPVSIDPEDAVGRPGGGLSFDGEAFVAVARALRPVATTSAGYDSQLRVS